MELKTRKLEANEIRAKICKVNNGGVKLLLWKSALADLNILDEALGAGYQISYPREGVCRISIWDEQKEQWLSREGIGEGISPKALANDALNRAGTAWGIGRELFTDKEIFIFKDKLKSWEKTDESGKPVYTCRDDFKVLNVEYQDDSISKLEIGIFQYGEIHDTVSFDFGSPEKRKKTTPKSAPASSAPQADKPVESPKGNETGTGMNGGTECLICDDEKLLIGNCRGKLYKDVKDTPTFLSFLKWALHSSTRYEDPKAQDQFLRMKKLAAKVIS